MFLSMQHYLFFLCELLLLQCMKRVLFVLNHAKIALVVQYVVRALHFSESSFVLGNMLIFWSETYAKEQDDCKARGDL